MLHESMETTKKMQYILNMSPVLNKDAMFSDGTEYSYGYYILLLSKNKVKFITIFLICLPEP